MDKVILVYPLLPLCSEWGYNDTRVTYVEVPPNRRLIDAIERAPWVATGGTEVEQVV